MHYNLGYVLIINIYLKKQGGIQMDSIVKYQEKYLDDIITLFINVFKEEPWNDNWFSNKQAGKYLLDIINIPGFEGYLYISNDEVIAGLFGHLIRWWEGDEYFIKEFFVDPDFQGDGIGSKMMDKLNKELKKNNINTIVLLTDLHSPAADFYKKRGFTEKSDLKFMYKNID
jgi:ribosomal protein S18 acetylase RimI-like enzyme